MRPTRMENSRMKKSPLPHLAAFALFFTALTSISRADLPSDIDSLLKDKSLAKVNVGVQVARLGSSASDSKILYRHADRTPLTPASNLKVLTTSAALDSLGRDFKFRTSLVLRNQDLLLWGD